MTKPMDLFEVMGCQVKESCFVEVAGKAYDKGMERILGEVAWVRLGDLEEQGKINVIGCPDVKERYEQVEKLKKKLIFKYGQEIAQDLFELDNAFTDLAVSECDVYFKKGFIEGYKFKKEAEGQR